MTLTINKLKLNSPFVLAPLAGITDGPFRRICFEMGASLAYSEMVSAKGLYYKSANTEELLKIFPGEGPVGYQLFGHEPEIMAWAVKKLEDYPNVLIDINMGCPVPKVVKNNEGSALMKDPKLAYEVVKAAVDATKKPVTVKIRAGFNDENRNAVEMAKVIEEAGASAVTVHGRTREQYYSGKADWGIIADVKSAVKIPVIGNGDCFNLGDAKRMMAETGVDGVMIARGALGNPWIFKEDEDGNSHIPTREERKEVMTKHLLSLAELKGDRVAVREMRKHVGWYLKGQPNAASFRNMVNQIDDIEELKKLIKNI